MANETGLRVGSTLRDGASDVPRVLVFDDDALQASALAMLLQDEGFDAVWASPWHAVTESLLHSLDAIVLDIYTPGHNGTEILMRARKRVPRLPAVVTSGLPEDDPRIVAAMAMPLVSYLCKPIDLRRLLGFLREALPSSRLGARLARLPVEIT